MQNAECKIILLFISLTPLTPLFLEKYSESNTETERYAIAMLAEPFKGLKTVIVARFGSFAEAVSCSNPRICYKATYA